ncbi:MAG: hypothetical protein AAGA48_11345 [Myxococcota bacterium]
MSEEELAQRVASTDRHDFDAMVELVEALAKAGRSRRQALDEAYGATFPDEFFAIAKARTRDRAPRGRYSNLPWQLVADAPRHDATFPQGLEDAARSVDPDLIPLLMIGGIDYVYGGSLLCYRLDELRDGRSTLFGFHYKSIPPYSEATKYGESLIAVLLDHCRDEYGGLESEIDVPYRRAAGAADASDLERSHDRLARVEAIYRSLTRS